MSPEAVNDVQQGGECYPVDNGVMFPSDHSLKVITTDEYIELMGGEFRETGLENGEETAVISMHYNHRDSRVRRGKTEECAIVVFQDVKANTGEPYNVGSFAQPTVYYKWQLSSQNPGLQIRITTSPSVVPKREAVCWVPLAAIRRSHNDNGNLEVHCSIHYGHNPVIREDLCWGPWTIGELTERWGPPIKELTGLASRDNLMQVHLELWQDPSKAPRFETGPQPCAVSWRGLSLRELSAIDANHEAQGGLYDAFEYTVKLFRRSKDWRIYRHWAAENTKSGWVLKTWIARSLFLTAKYGEMWHYQLQLNNEQPFRSVFASDTKLGKLEPPRNLVVDWVVEIDEKGETIGRPKAHWVQSYTMYRTTTVYARADIMSLQLRLAIERNRQPHMQVLRSTFNTNQFDVKATFHTRSDRPGLYVVELRASNDRLLNLNGNPRVKANTKLEMAVEPSEASGLEEGWVGTEPIVFEGVVIEDVFGSDEQVTAIFEGPSLEPFVELRDGVELLVKVELKGDPTPTDRHQATIKEIEAGVQRTKGVDLSSLILRAPPSIVETDSLARQMTNLLRGLVMGVANVFNLNDDQTGAVKNATESSSGVTAICGQPGTGKSWNVAAIGYAHVCVGKLLGDERRRPVLACAPTNVAVDTLMSHFLAGTNHDGTFDNNNLVIVRYRGSLPRENLSLADGLDFFDHADPHARYSFYVQRENKINEWAASETHIMKGTAQSFIDMRARMYASDGGRELSESAAFDLKSRLGDAEDLLNSYFFQHVVDIVFCTNSSSAQGMLRKWYKPKILLSDDLTTCSIPDGATPIGAFQEHIEHWTMAGDYTGQKPILAFRRCNEWASILLQSLFQWTVDPRLDDSFFVELRAQYRSDTL